MGIIGGRLGYMVLRTIGGNPRLDRNDQHHDGEHTSLEQWFGDGLSDTIRDKIVIDFGCGEGNQTIELAQRGAAKVIGLDVQTDRLALATEMAAEAGVSDRCEFTTQTAELADVIISKDAFEHFQDPGLILETMFGLLKPGGVVLAAFGPTWLHPLGGHGFSVFPWSHLIFTERAQIKWRADFKKDGATRFSEVDGGLNKLTIKKFERLVATSPFQMEWITTVPIKGMGMLKNRFFREWGSSIVRCQLRKSPQSLNGYSH